MNVRRKRRRFMGSGAVRTPEILVQSKAMEPLLAACAGIARSAACGCRVFVPLLVMGIAAHSAKIDLAPGFDWVGSWPAMILFGTATAAEIAAYFVPWIDNAL